ncbi:MAG: IS630 family transposase [Candidatus Aminicenantes bacterium]|nr:IS630 family transposase [Candidatus Aminicenantes bacterium]
MRPSGDPQLLEQRRLKAIALFQEGFQPVEIARKLGVNRRSVRLWKAHFLSGGPEALRARPTPGRPWKLKRTDRAALETLLLRGARASGYATDLWTCPRVAQVIARKFGVHYHVDHIGRLLRSLGWSPQKPERRAIERDEEAIQRWVKMRWPKVKKTPHGLLPR